MTSVIANQNRSFTDVPFASAINQRLRKRGYVPGFSEAVMLLHVKLGISRYALGKFSEISAHYKQDHEELQSSRIAVRSGQRLLRQAWIDFTNTAPWTTSLLLCGGLAAYGAWSLYSSVEGV
jgi:hypothetical protein